MRQTKQPRDQKYGQSQLFVAMVLLCCETALGWTQVGNEFDSAAVGSLPKGWASAKTGSGDGSVWEIRKDATSPTGKHVLTQSSNTAPSSMFNLCVKRELILGEVALQVSLKALSGKTDQGGGPVWRLQDENNYYIARFNPLERSGCAIQVRVQMIMNGRFSYFAGNSLNLPT